MSETESFSAPIIAAGTSNSWGRTWSEFRAPILILLAHVPLLVFHFLNLSHRPQYQHFPIVFLIAGGLFWTRLKPLPEGTVGPLRRQRAYTLFACSLLLLVAGTIIFSPWFAAISFVLAVGGTILILRERFELPNAFGIWLVCLLLVPIPGTYDERLSQGLQRLTTVVSGGCLEQIGIPNIIEGTTLSLSTRRLFIEEACSGVVSMMAITASCLIVAVLANRPWLHLVLLVGSGVAWAAVTNVMRIVTLAFSQERLGVDLSEGWRHDLLGLVLFAIALLLAVSTDQLLSFLLGPVQDDPDAEHFSRIEYFWDWVMTLGHPITATTTGQTDEPQPTSFHPPLQQSKGLTAFAGLFLVTGLVGLAMGIMHLSAGDPTIRSATTEPLLAVMEEDFLPAQVGDWIRVGYDEQHVQRLFAQESRVWRYRNGDLQATFALDFMFPRWHDLCECYRSIGWSQNGKSQVVATEVDGGDYLTAEFFKNENEEGSLCFSLIEDSGKPFAPPATLSSIGQFKRRLQADRSLYQLQLWITEQGDLSDLERESAQVLFRRLRARIVKQIVSVGAGQPTAIAGEQ